jgi:antitoxin (DNA-binding transcriptional repressor) of toxin-antitoxin stability system
MLTISARELQHHLGSFLDRVAAGETIVVLRRKKVIARIVPSGQYSPAEPWPDLRERLDAIYPEGPIEPSASDLLYQDRGER